MIRLNHICKMSIREITYKTYKTLWAKNISCKSGEFTDYCEKYRSYRHMVRASNKDSRIDGSNFYMAARPNPCAGIGHQIANWNAGYWFARQFGLKFAHIPFSTQRAPFVSGKWDKFLNFGANEARVKDLLRKGYQAVLLPRFDETKQDEISIISDIIGSYSGRKIVFILEQDQFYMRQYDLSLMLRAKFFAIHPESESPFSNQYTNIVIHIRRGDIVALGKQQSCENDIRWLSNSYYVNALKYTLGFQFKKPIRIYLFSQGREEDFDEFREFDNIEFCLDLDEIETFRRFVFADYLITSKSSFSYKAGLINKGIKIAPRRFWHAYPETNEWLLLDDYGNPTF